MDRIHRQVSGFPREVLLRRSLFLDSGELILILSRFMVVDFLENQGICPLLRCFSFLQNLHSLEIGSSDYGPDTTRLRKELGRIILPQMKTLIIPESAHPLLEHCPNVEDVAWVISDKPIASDEFLQSLTSSCDSKVERLMIPLVLPGSPSRKLFDILWYHEIRMMANHNRLQL